MSFLELSDRYRTLLCGDRDDDLLEPIGVKFFRHQEPLPELRHEDSRISVPWCGAIKLALEGEPIIIDKETIGCPGGAIALGLVDQNQEQPLEGEREYTSFMERPAAPRDFTDGYVYACRASEHMEFALFGPQDSGRYGSLEAARRAISSMAAIQPPIMRAVICYRARDLAIEPEVVVLAVTPRQALRIIQGHAFFSGEHVELKTIGIRGVCSDVTARPFLEKKLNASFFCLGARVIAGWEGCLMTLGMPFDDLRVAIRGIEASLSGFPYLCYPK